MSGIIAANHNGLGLVGVAPEASLHELKVFDDNGGFVYSSALIDAAYKCRDAGAKIISMSLGGEYPVVEEQEIFSDFFHNDGILSVASSGNDGDRSHSYPASYDDVLSVGALNRLKERASFSQYTDKVDLIAPGFDIWSTLPNNYDCAICQALVCKGYGSLSGTSVGSKGLASRLC